jgi:hypothetical protein
MGINMDPNDPKYLIKLSQLKELRSTKSTDRRIEIYLDVVTPGPYKEKSAGDAILGSIGKGMNAALDKLDKMTDPKNPPKKGSGGK